jgi:predicted ATP-dependent serine protease
MCNIYVNCAFKLLSKQIIMENQIKSIKVKDVVVSNDPTLKTGNEKFDNWFSKRGGMVLRSSIFISGTSGAGKTTLMVNLMNWLTNTVTCMYEREVESKDVCEQTSNIKPTHDNAYMCDKKSHPHFNDFMKELEVLKPKVIIIDSLQAIAMEDFPSMSEDDACNYIIKILRTWTSDNDAVLFLVGHNTKEGEFAGRNTIMQFMDVHMDLVYDKKTNTRTMSFGKKNRKGPMGTLFYTFEESGIELYTPEEWDARANDRNFKEKFMQFVVNYVASSNKKNDICVNFINEYKKGIKNISKIENDSQACENLFALMLNLSDKYEG